MLVYLTWIETGMYANPNNNIKFHDEMNVCTNNDKGHRENTGGGVGGKERRKKESDVEIIPYEMYLTFLVLSSLREQRKH